MPFPAPRPFSHRIRLAAAFVALLVVVIGGAFLSGPDRGGRSGGPRSNGTSSARPGAAPAAEVRTPRRGPEAPTDWYYMQRSYPSGTINEKARSMAVAQARALRGENAKAASLPWLSLGPVNIGGRVTDIVADPANPSIVYVGAASGGVWKSTDTGATWTPIFDGAGSPSIGALAMDPSDANTIYAGTGESNAGGGSVAYGGDGVWKTTDGGGSWTQLGLEGTASIGRIVVDPANPERVYVAATGNLYAKGPDRGVYRTTDGGGSWQNVLFVSDSTGCADLAIDPATPTRVYASMWERTRRPSIRRYGGPTSGIYRTTDGGDSWTLLSTGLPLPATRPGRIGIAVAPSSPSTVYAIYPDSTGYFAGFFRSVDSGTTWARQSDSALSGFYSSFGWWFGRIWVHPTNPAVIFAPGLPLMRSTNSGNGWSDVSASMHVDNHAMWISPLMPNVIWEGNDGGLYRSTNGGTAWTHIVNLPITQFYTNEVHPSQPNKVYGGTQDNGTIRTLGGVAAWTDVYGGDGHYVNVDPNNTNVIYAEYQYGVLVKSTNDGATFFSATSGISGRANWSTPVVIEPASAGKPQTTLYYGANRLFRSTNSAASWTAVSPDLSDGDPGANGVVYGTITTVAVAPSDSATIYVGTDDANVWVSTDAGSSWTKVDGALPERWVTRLAVDPTNDAIAYATLSGFREAEYLPHVFRTTDWGASWADISGNLPEAPVNDLIVDSATPSILYVATDVGVYETQDLGATWFALAAGMPLVVVNDLDYLGGVTPVLYAGTYGRSMYRLDAVSGTLVEGPRDGFGLGAGEGPSLSTAAPNPFRDATRIAFALPRAGRARLDILDVAGRRVATLVARDLPSGAHDAAWDGRDEHGRRVASGAYFARLESGEGVASRKILLAR